MIFLRFVIDGRQGKDYHDCQNDCGQVHEARNGQKYIEAIHENGKGPRKDLSQGQEGEQVALWRRVYCCRHG